LIKEKRMEDKVIKAIKALLEIKSVLSTLPKVVQDAVNMCKNEVELCCRKYNVAEGNYNVSSTAIAIIALENLIRLSKTQNPEKLVVKYQEDNPNMN